MPFLPDRSCTKNAACAFFFCLAFFLSVSGNKAFAFDDTLYTQDEKVGFAFYKLGDIEPSFDDWIKNAPLYQAARSPEEKADIYSREDFRLHQGYTTYYPEFGMITIKVPINIYGSPKELLDELSPGDDKIMTIETQYEDGSFYFPYPVGKEWVTVIPIDMKDFKTITVTGALYRTVGGGLSFHSERKPKEGILEIVVQPRSVNTDLKVEIDGMETWLMDARIASISLWFGIKNTLLWEYTAPWYVSETRQTLQHLYNK